MNCNIIIKSYIDLASGVYLLKDGFFKVLIIPQPFMELKINNAYLKKDIKVEEIISIYCNVVINSTDFGNFIKWYWLVNKNNRLIQVYAKSENNEVNEYLYYMNLLKFEKLEYVNKGK